MGLGRIHEAKRLILGGEYFFSAVTGIGTDEYLMHFG